MILADKIIELRKKNGWSQEDLAEKMDVSRQSISKWEGAQSVPDMNRILRLSEIFGVSTDFLLKDDMEFEDTPAGYTSTADAGASASGSGRGAYEAKCELEVRTVSMEEAQGFMDYKAFAAGRIAIGVLLCILSPILLIVLSSAAEAGRIGVTEGQAAGFGLAVLIILVGAAVALFVTTGLRGKRYEYFEKEAIETLYGVDGAVKDRREKYRSTYTWQLVTGIVLCVLAVIPLFVTMMIFGDQDTPYNDYRYAAAVGVLLLLVAIGVFLIVRACIVWGGFQMLLETGDYTRAHKIENKKNEHIDAIYWGAAIVIYLAWSFITMQWQMTWIVWPIAGVGYGLLVAILRAVRSKG